MSKKADKKQVAKQSNDVKITGKIEDKVPKNTQEVREVFAFNKENEKKVKEIIAQYPEGRERSATLPLLDIAQRQNNGWLSVDAIEHVANVLKLSYMRVFEVASFYSMFNLKPVGKYHIQVCGTTPCWLRGASTIKAKFEEEAKVKCSSGISDDGLFTISEVECLGACINAPIVQINDDYFEDLTEESAVKIINDLKNKK